MMGAFLSSARRLREILDKNMPDIFTKEKRSEIMSKIKSTSGIEIKFRKLLSKQIYPLGHRYRLNYRKAVGKPDLAFVSKRLAVFIDGDFWHGKHFAAKGHKLSAEYWQPKIKGNMDRDKRQNRLLRKTGWKVVRIWESDIRKKPEASIQKIVRHLSPDAPASRKRG